MKKIYFLLIITISFSQQLSPIEVAVDDLRNLVENASRSNQRVFVDDFTGLL